MANLLPDRSPTEAVAELVRDALGQLYDFGALQEHPLVDVLAEESSLRPEQLPSLHTLLLEAVDRLVPEGGVSFRDRRARSHSVIRLHYVEGLSVDATAQELAISQRQTYRELRAAENHVAALLFQMLAEQGARVDEELEHDGVQHLAAQTKRIEVAKLLTETLELVNPLAESRQVTIEPRVSPAGAAIVADPVLAQHAILHLLSHSVQRAEHTSQVRVCVSVRLESAVVAVTFHPIADDAGSFLPPGWLELVKALSPVAPQVVAAEHDLEIRFCLTPPQSDQVLVVDDNSGLVDLFRRYLHHERCSIHGAADGIEGLRLAREMHPTMMVLDVLMPPQGGWSVLKELRSDPTTRDIFVAVCSVLRDPELAQSLGADHFLSKPVDRHSAIEALRLCRACRLG